MLNAETYELLSKLSLVMNHKSSLNRSGNRKSLQTGISAEFSDFREYMPGDDLRRLDWNVYARSERMYIREYLEEKEAVVSVLLDTSASMDYGRQKKSDLSIDLCGAVAFLTLNNMDRLVLYDSNEINRPFTVSGGKNALPKVFNWLEKRSFRGETNLFSAVKKMKQRGAGVTVIISDFLTAEMLDEADENPEKTMKYLAYKKQRPLLFHTLCAEELRIGMEGTRNLIDMETGQKLRVTMTESAITAYERELNKLMTRLNKGCRACGGAYMLCDSEKDRSQLILEDVCSVCTG